MRNIQEITDSIATKLREDFSSARAVAVGGSRSATQEDNQSDLDLVVLIREGPIIKQSREINKLLKSILDTPASISAGPSWKEGFGCRTSLLYQDGFKIEIFVNTLDTVPQVHRVLRWQPVWGDSVLAEIQEEVNSRLSRQAILLKAIFDYSYAHMSICRHLSRGEKFAAGHVFTSMVAIALALRLLELNQNYDPVSSYKRVYRDRLDQDPVILEISAASGFVGGSMSAIQEGLCRLTNICVFATKRLHGNDEAVKKKLADFESLWPTCEKWIG